MGKLGSTENDGETKHLACLAVMRLFYLTVNILRGSFVMRFLMRSTINICECGEFVCLLSSLFWQVLFVTSLFLVSFTTL